MPRYASAHWYVRSADLDSLEALKPRVLDCLEAGALAAGCEMDFDWKDPAYSDMVDDPWLLGRYAANSAALGRSSRTPARSARSWEAPTWAT